MKTNKHGEQIYSEDDLCNLVMRGTEVNRLSRIIVDPTVDLETAADMLEHIPDFIRYDSLVEKMPTEEFDHRNQSEWFMPEEYKQLDIAAFVLGLCTNEAELQRCGEELLLYQERNLFDLLRYLKYLVDTMTKNRLIWGVGRGSSVASYVLYKLKVHKIDSIYYELDPREFLR
jgi:DNA polymerase III alpha subunit